MCWNAGKAAQNSHKQFEQTLTVCVFVPVFHLLQTVAVFFSFIDVLEELHLPQTKQ